jgi:uncharacterized protein (DUF2147 family)
MMSLKFLSIIFLTLFCGSNAFSNTGGDAIIGEWMAVQGNVKVQVFREGNEYKAKILWFKDTDDKSKPMHTRTDEKNPNPKLRSRKVLGMETLSELTYNAKSGRWENGVIYDPKTGREWSSVVYFNKEGLLNVKGYWKFEFIGKNMTFKKVG